MSSIRATKRWQRLAVTATIAAVALTACSGNNEPDASDNAGTAPGTATDDSGATDGTGETDGTGATNDTVDATQGGSVLDKVKERGTVVCGGNDTLAGFGIIDASTNEYSGFDIDFCKALAAAVLGDSTKFEIKPLEAAERFPTLQSGEIDVLIRNTTWTASRDGAEQATFGHTTFYDGQGFMVHESSNINSIQDMAGASICVQTGTTTLTNLNAKMADLGIEFTSVTFESNDQLQPAFVAEQCQVWTSDASQLAAFAVGMTETPTRILTDIISKEPLGPAVADGDSQWAQIVDWVTMSTIQAWELGITSANVDEMKTSEDSNVLTFLGQPVVGDDGKEATADFGLGLDPTAFYEVVKQVGNYQEIYERNLAPIGLTLDGSVNDLWSNGGLMYTPPFR